ncbi:hypothetical protein LCGC14_2043880, partial [marine sediment metagenome]
MVLVQMFKEYNVFSTSWDKLSLIFPSECFITIGA